MGRYNVPLVTSEAIDLYSIVRDANVLDDPNTFRSVIEENAAISESREVHELVIMGPTLSWLLEAGIQLKYLVRIPERGYA